MTKPKKVGLSIAGSLLLIAILICIFVINWSIVFFPFYQKKLPMISADQVMNTSEKTFKFEDKVLQVYIKDQNRITLKLENVQDIQIFTHFFDNIENGNTYTFTVKRTELNKKPALFVIRVDKQILTPLFFLNYFMVVVVILLIAIALLFWNFVTERPKLTEEEEANLYKTILEKYLSEDEFYNKVNNSDIFIIPRFLKTKEILEMKYKLEKDEEKKKRINKFLIKCFGNKKGGTKHAEKNNQDR